VLGGIGDAVSTARLGAPASDVGSEVAGVLTALLSTVNASPHEEVGDADDSRFSVDVVATGSTAKGSPHDDVAADEMPRRERRVVFRREDLRMLALIARYVLNLLLLLVICGFHNMLLSPVNTWNLRRLLSG
jgi:hypothetical protein